MLNILSIVQHDPFSANSTLPFLSHIHTSSISTLHVLTHGETFQQFLAFYELDAPSTLSMVANVFVVWSYCSRGMFLSLNLYYFLTIPSLLSQTASEVD
jgi:hypothetical protein